MIPYTLVDIESGKSFEPTEVSYLSPEGEAATEPGGVLRGTLEVQYDWTIARRKLSTRSFYYAEPHDFTTWRYRSLFPLERPEESLPPLRTGGSPLLTHDRLAKRFGIWRVNFKDEGRNPSGSYKDRASELVVARAVESGADTIVAASTGNAASALSVQAAAKGLRAVVFVPESAPQGKLVQMLACGATVVRVKGSYDTCLGLSMAASKRFGWLNRNTGYNPYTTDGKRTAAFEICEQSNWSVPDFVAVSAGDGNILSGLEKGFRDMKDLGLIVRLPRILAVQAEGANAIVSAFEKGLQLPEVKRPSTSHAESIVVEAPQSGVMALRALRNSIGAAVSVSEEAIRDAHQQLAREGGLFVEPSCAATWAGVLEARNRQIIGPEEIVCVVLTGNGLKDTASALKWAAMPEVHEPLLDDIVEKLQLA